MRTVAATAVRRWLPMSIVVLLSLCCLGGWLRLFSGRSGPLCDHGNILSLSASPSGSLVAAAGRQGRSEDGRLSLYQLDSGKEIASLLWDHKKFLALAFDPSGSGLAVADEAGNISLWSVSDGTSSDEPPLELVGLVKLEAVANALAFSPRGRMLAAGCADHTVRLLDRSTGRVVGEFSGHQQAVSAVAYDPKGQRLVSGGGRDGSVRIWDVPSRKELLTLRRGVSDVADVEFSPDGKYVVATYGVTLDGPFEPSRPMEYPNEQVRIWDAGSGSMIHSFRVAGDRANSVSFGSDGDWITVAYECVNAAPDDAEEVAVVFSIPVAQRLAGLRRSSGMWAKHTAASGDLLAATFGTHIGLWDLVRPSKPRLVWERQWHWWDKVKRYSDNGGVTYHPSSQEAR